MLLCAASPLEGNHLQAPLQGVPTPHCPVCSAHRRKGEVSGLVCGRLGCPPPFNPGLHLAFPRLLLTQEQDMCILRWPDIATALQTSSPYPWSRVRLPLVLPGIFLTSSLNLGWVDSSEG